MYGVQLMLNLLQRTLIISVKPKYAREIADGRKTVELRRRFTNAASIGSLVLIYSSSPQKQIVASAEIVDVRRLPIQDIWLEYATSAAIERDEFDQYFSGLQSGFVIKLDNVRKLTKPVPSESLQKHFGFRAPQSYGYFSPLYRALVE